jgi:hypothetical protein
MKTHTETEERVHPYHKPSIGNLGGNAHVIRFIAPDRVLALAGLIRMEVRVCRDRNGNLQAH